MFETSAEPAAPATGNRRRHHRLGLVAAGAVVVLAATVVTVIVPRGGASAAPLRATVAGSAPSLTAGLGAAFPFVEDEPANAKTNGTVLAESRARDTLAVEAVGRRAVTPEGRGKYVEFTLSPPANSIAVRYSIPASADGSA